MGNESPGEPRYGIEVDGITIESKKSLRPPEQGGLERPRG